MKLPASTFGLKRTSSGLSEAHVALIKLLAEKAVNDYLAETDTPNEADRKAPR